MRQPSGPPSRSRSARYCRFQAGSNSTASRPSSGSTLRPRTSTRPAASSAGRSKSSTTTTRPIRPRPSRRRKSSSTRDGVLALVGPITSRNLDAMAPVVESLKTPLLYATNYEGGKVRPVHLFVQHRAQSGAGAAAAVHDQHLRQELFPARRRPALAAQDVRSGGADHPEARRPHRRHGIHHRQGNRFCAR